MADVAYLIQDMLFSSKIRETAKPLGLTAQGARDVAGLLTAARTGARLVVLDLRLPVAFDALGALAGDPALAGLPKVGFIDHELIDVMERARAAGCEQVMTKGQFANGLPRLLATLTPAAT